MFDGGLYLSGDVECNAQDSWSDIASHNYHAWLKFGEFGLSALNIGLNTQTASVKIDNESNIFLNGNVNVKNSNGDTVSLKEYIEACIEDYLNTSFSKTLIKTETP